MPGYGEVIKVLIRNFYLPGLMFREQCTAMLLLDTLQVYYKYRYTSIPTFLPCLLLCFTFHEYMYEQVFQQLLLFTHSYTMLTKVYARHIFIHLQQQCTLHSYQHKNASRNIKILKCCGKISFRLKHKYVLNYSGNTTEASNGCVRINRLPW